MAVALKDHSCWECLRLFLPFDLDSLAAEHGALVRRRGVSGGEALLRALCLCVLPKATFERASLQAKELGLAQMNPTAMFNRFCKAENFFQALFMHALTQAPVPAERWGSYRLLAVDATTLSGPGSKGTDQRLHTAYDLGSGRALSVEVTTSKGGETLARYTSFGKGDLVLGDRGYGHGKGLLSALQTGAMLLIRFEFDSIRLLDEAGNKIRPEDAAERMAGLQRGEMRVLLPGWDAPLRAIGTRNLEGEIIWLLTSLSREELGLEQARDLYSRRWQIELFFKRLKSLMDLDEIPTRDGPSARAWIWAKLLLATLAALSSHERFSPWGYPVLSLETTRDGSLGPLQGSPHSLGPQRISKRQAKRKEIQPRQNPQATLALEA
jgi:hypothetical protein